jgi:predicted ester cyclase
VTASGPLIEPKEEPIDMGTGESKQLVQDFVETVLNGHDVDAIPRFVDNESLVMALRGLLTGVPDLRLTTQHLFGEGEMVAIRVTGEGTHTGVWRGLEPTGKIWKATCNAHYRVENGRITGSWVNWDWLSIMEQLEAVKTA